MNLKYYGRTGFKAEGIQIIAVSLLVCLFLAFGPAGATELVDIHLNPEAREYTPEKPVVQVSQNFLINQPGVLTIHFYADPYQGQLVRGGYDWATKDGSSIYLGPEISWVRDPTPGIKGQPYEVTTVIKVNSPSDKPLVAWLTAYHQCQAFQVCNLGSQYSSTMRLVIDFVPEAPNKTKCSAGQCTSNSGKCYQEGTHKMSDGYYKCSQGKWSKTGGQG